MPIPSMIAQFDNPLEKFRKQNGTDLAYINQLGSKVGHVFYIDPGPKPGRSIAYWGPEIRHGKSQRPLTMNMDAANNVISLSFSYDGLARTQQVVMIQEENTKFPIPIPVPDLNPLKPKLARESASSLKIRQMHNGTAKMKPAEAAQLALALSLIHI